MWQDNIRELFKKAKKYQKLRNLSSQRNNKRLFLAQIASLEEKNTEIIKENSHLLQLKKSAGDLQRYPFAQQTGRVIINI